MRSLLSALALTFVTLAAGCSSSPTGLAAAVPGSSWTMERVVMADGSVERGDGAQLSFGTDGSVVMASCNLCSGRYSVADDVLTVDGTLACTRRACPSDAVELESLMGPSATLRRDGVFLIVEPLDGVADQILFVPAGS